MLKRSFISSLLLITLLPHGAFPESPKGRVKGPITVTSETLTTDNRSHTALFERNVTAKTPDMTIYADRMLVFYNEQGGDVTKIESTGNVRLNKDSRVITAETATYYADEEKVVFIGEPRAMDGENVVTGTRMTYYINEDRSIVEKSKVFLKNRKDR